MESAGHPTSKSAKESRDEKQKDSKMEEQIIKSLGNSNTIEDKFNALVKKFAEIEKENKKLTTNIKLHEKRYEGLLREKDNLQKEYNKGVLMRDKLEQICREQQKLIKSVKNESLSKIREEEERRKENQVKFQQSINEINATLGKNNEENLRLKEDNIEMTKKLKYLAEQYQAREKQQEKINEQISLENQLHEAKLAKAKMDAAIEKKILLQERKNAVDELEACRQTIKDLQNQEKLLREELNLYSSKYDDFQSSLQKSNDIFTSYKSEIEKMCKKTKKLEKESAEWKRKCGTANEAVIELATQKKARDIYITKITKQMEQLQKLLRTLQAERTTLHQILKDNNIERPPMPVLPPEPEPSALPPPPTPQKNDKLDLMVKNCAELKQTLAKLQGQVNEITSKQTTDKPPVEEPKKNKNKKSKGKQKVCPTKDSTKVQTSNSSDQVPEEDNPTEQSEIGVSTDANCAEDGRVSPLKEVGGDNAGTTENSSNKPSEEDICKHESTEDTANESVNLDESISKEDRIKEENSMENVRVESKTEQPQTPLADTNPVSEEPLLVQSQNSSSVTNMEANAEKSLITQPQRASPTANVSAVLEESLGKHPQNPSIISNENAAPEQSLAAQPQNLPTTTPDII